jgi:hypothetical protein
MAGIEPAIPVQLSNQLVELQQPDTQGFHFRYPPKPAELQRPVVEL